MFNSSYFFSKFLNFQYLDLIFCGSWILKLTVHVLYKTANVEILRYPEHSSISVAPCYNEPVWSTDFLPYKHKASLKLWFLNTKKYQQQRTVLSVCKGLLTIILVKQFSFFFLQVKYIPHTYFYERWKTSALGTKVIIFPPKITPVQTQRYNNVVCGACTSAKLYRQ